MSLLPGVLGHVFCQIFWHVKACTSHRRSRMRVLQQVLWHKARLWFWYVCCHVFHCIPTFVLSSNLQLAPAYALTSLLAFYLANSGILLRVSSGVLTGIFSDVLSWRRSVRAQTDLAISMVRSLQYNKLPSAAKQRLGLLTAISIKKRVPASSLKRLLRWQVRWHLRILFSGILFLYLFA